MVGATVELVALQTIKGVAVPLEAAVKLLEVSDGGYEGDLPPGVLPGTYR